MNLKFKISQLESAMKNDKPTKPGEIPFPGKGPETIPAPVPEPGIWPKKEPEIQPEREPLTTPPPAPPEITKSPDDSRNAYGVEGVSFKIQTKENIIFIDHFS